MRRLLSYAGLGDLGVDIEVGAKRPRDVVDEYSEKPDPDADPLHHAAGWFMGIEDEVCHFGVADSALRDEESLIGTLGHEVAHAYRERHGLCVVSRDTEEKLTDLTTIYLGFGFFTLQSSFVFKTGHRDDAGRLLLYERQMLGYLRPGQLALLLAVQLVIRKQGASELRRVLDALAPNHAEALERAYRSLAKQREGLIEQLGLPSDTEWPEPHDLARPQSAAIAEAEQNARLEACGHRQQSLHLVDAHHQRKLLRLTNVIDLFRKIQSTAVMVQRREWQARASWEPPPLTRTGLRLGWRVVKSLHTT